MIEYLIDGNGRRVAKKVDGQLAKRWLYAGGLLPVAELDSSGAVEKRYGPGYVVRNDTTYRMITDHLGSVRMVVNSQTGEIVQRIDYDAWGTITSLQNPDEFTDIGFAGGLYDSDTGLIRFGARDYDPEVGRWTAKDPILFDGGTSNLYEYALNDPVNNIDPDGLQTLTNVRDFVGAAVGEFSTIPFTNFSISDTLLGLIGNAGYYNPCSDAAYAGEWLGTIGQIALGGLATAERNVLAKLGFNPVKQGNFITERIFRWGKGPFKYDGVTKARWHFQMGGKELMRHHLPYQFKQWGHTVISKVERTFK